MRLTFKITRSQTWIKNYGRIFLKIETIVIPTIMEEDQEATMARFICGLNRVISNVVKLQNYVELENVVHMAIIVEMQLKEVVNLLQNLTGLVPHGIPNGVLLRNKKKIYLPRPVKRNQWPRPNLIKIYFLPNSKNL